MVKLQSVAYPLLLQPKRFMLALVKTMQTLTRSRPWTRMIRHSVRLPTRTAFTVMHTPLPKCFQAMLWQCFGTQTVIPHCHPYSAFCGDLTLMLEVVPCPRHTIPLLASGGRLIGTGRIATLSSSLCSVVSSIAFVSSCFVVIQCNTLNTDLVCLGRIRALYWRVSWALPNFCIWADRMCCFSIQTGGRFH
jgi:hypothetical protein